MSLTLIATLTLGLQAAPVTPAPAPSRVQPAPAQPGAPVAAPPSLPPEPGTTTADPFTAPEPTPEPTPAAPPPTVAPTIYYMPDAEPTKPEEAAATSEAIEQLKYRRLVFSNFYGINFGISPVPSGELSVFLGTNLRPRRSSVGKDWNTALGYQVTLSLGLADDPTVGSSAATRDDDCLEFDFCFNPTPIFFHRHALMAQGYGGKKGRLYYALGGGAVLWNTQLVGIEGEGKLGYIFSAREGSRVKGIVGGQMRLSGAFDGAPLPQFGGFIGFMVF